MRAFITSANSSSKESNARKEPPWKHLKKKHKDLSDQHCEFATLNFISVDTAIFDDGIACSIMPLINLAHQVIIIFLISNFPF